MLHIWTGADTALVRRFTKPVFGSHPHCIVPINETPQIAGDSDVVLALGGKAVDKLVRGKMVPKNRTISSLRGKRISGPKTGCSFLVSFDPSLVHRDAKVEEELRWDMRLAQRLHDTGTIRPLLGDYRWVPDLTELIDSIKVKHKKTSKPVTVAMDTETMGLFPWFAAKKIVTSQWTDEEGRAFVLDHRLNAGALTDLQADQIRWLLSSTIVRLWGANLKYDLQWIWRKWKIGCLNFTFDLVLAGSLLNENRHNSLKALTKSYVPELGGYEEELESVQDKDEMEKTPDDVLLRYAGCDPDATLRSGNVVARELAQDKGLTRFYTKLLHPAARAFERFEDRGVFVNVKAYLNLEKEVKEEIRTLTRDIMGMIPLRVRARYSDNLSLTRPVLIRDALFSSEGFGLKPTIFTEKTEDLPPDEQIPSTSLKEHLGQFRAHPEAGPLIQKLEDWQSAKKTASTYIGKRSSDGKRFSKGFLSHLRPDGRFHPSYALHAGALFEDEDNEAGTNTGRLSAKNPAIQCMVGETLVVTNYGPRRLDWLVETKGACLKVLTHTGEWRSIVGVYRNGVQPVYEVLTAKGHKIVCTGNHPILTSRGWVRTDKLETSDVCYVTRSSQPAEYESYLLQLGGDEKSVSVSNLQRLEELRRAGNQGVREVAEIRELSSRHGGEAWEGVVYRTQGQRGGLQTRELCVGETLGAAEQPAGYEAAHAQQQDTIRSQVGSGVWDKQGMPALQAEQGRNDAPCFETFEACEVASVQCLGERETFDLTIDRCHSFVANGMVVHNTLPKHTKWAKRLRSCYIAPPGYLCWQIDFSQGELRVAACLADEQNMLRAYREGIDLHAKTAASANSIPLDVFLSWEDPAHPQHDRYKALRQGGKAGNFGLLYAMGARGFMDYAWKSYRMLMTLEQAEAFRNGFFDTYPGLLDWHDKYRALAHKQGFIRSPLGRVRHLPLIHSPDRQIRSKAERQAINSPVQGTLSDLNLWGASEIEAVFGSLTEDGKIDGDLIVVGTTHDSMEGYVREAQAETLIREACAIVAKLPIREVFGWDHQISFPVDAEIGPDRGHLAKLKLAA